jgi:hypothetical protein
MLADASISHAGVSKAKPQCAARLAIGAHARRLTAAQGGRQAAAVARHTGRAGRLVRSWIRIEGRRRSWRRGQRGLSPAPRQGEGGESGRRSTLGRGGVSWSYHARWGADVGVAELAGGLRRRCARVGEGRRVGKEWCIGEGRRIGEGPVIGKGHVGDGRGEERRWRRRRKRGEVPIWGKRISANLEGDGAYIEPPPFVTGHIPNRD